jgi:hypothetical protein
MTCIDICIIIVAKSIQHALYKALLYAVPMLKATFHIFNLAFWELIDSKISMDMKDGIESS